MKSMNIITRSIIMMLLVSAGLHAQAPQEIVKKSVEAIGGEAAIQQQFNFKATGEFEFSRRGMTVKGDLELILKGRKSYRKVNMNFGGMKFVMVQSYNGKISWIEARGNVVNQPALNSETELDHTFALLIKKEAKFTKAKDTEVEGKKALGVQVEFNGKKTIFYFDSETFLPLEVSYKDYFFGDKNTKELLDRKTQYLDYKKQGSVMYPSRMVIFNKGQKIGEMKIATVVFNPNIADDFFDRPDEELDFRYGEERMN